VNSFVGCGVVRTAGLADLVEVDGAVAGDEWSSMLAFHSGESSPSRCFVEVNARSTASDRYRCGQLPMTSVLWMASVDITGGS
jgi:hypothetical protein